ncbi:hypothetical protein GCM10020254_80200 [Streptomyces goshikiensis]
MRLRLRSDDVQRAGEAAGEAATLAEAEADRMETLLSRAQLLLRAAEDLGDTSGLEEVWARVSGLAGGELKPSHVGLVLMGEDGLLRQVAGAEAGQAPWTGPEEGYGADSGWPGARAVREGRTVVVTDRRKLAREYAPEAVAGFDALGLHTLACVPLSGSEGVLALGWDIPHVVDAAERAVLIVLADYTARAVERAAYLDDRVSIALRLQQAMLTDLVRVPGLETAAMYRPAARQEMVGGDWYDLYPLLGPPGAWAVTVGDITGHDLGAATLMGQLRSMLRQADIDHPDRPPAPGCRGTRPGMSDAGPPGRRHPHPRPPHPPPRRPLAVRVDERGPPSPTAHPPRRTRRTRRRAPGPRHPHTSQPVARTTNHPYPPPGPGQHAAALHRRTRRTPRAGPRRRHG